MSGAISLGDFVRDQMDREEFESQDEAAAVIESRYAMHSLHALSLGERARVAFVVSLEWNNRYLRAEALV